MSTSHKMICDLRVKCAVVFPLILLCLSVGHPVAADDDETAIPVFDLDVVQVMRRHCFKCHGEGESRKGGLDLRDLAAMRRGGKHGPALIDRAPLKSRLYKRIVDASMPPKGHPRLTLAERSLIRRWIEAGALKDRDFDKPASKSQLPLVSDADRDNFAWKKLRRPEQPPVKAVDRVRTPVDAFLLALLEEQGLSFAPDAAPLTLVRRLSFDLIGLPPSPEQVTEFEGQWKKDPDVAYRELVNRLLQSPHFGVRWGRHWLDAAGYVDVCGSDENAPLIRLPRGGWKYRDYVVKSLNDDKPYDRFLVQQIAGDELVDWRNADPFTPDVTELLVATGFLRTAIDDTDQEVLDIPSNRYAVLFDQIEIFGSSVLGLTLQCARCHSHKFDPIPQRDYYRLMANFTTAYNIEAWTRRDRRDLPDVPAKMKKDIDEHNADCDRRIGDLNKPLHELDWSANLRLLPRKLEKIPESDRRAVQKAFGPPEKQSEEDKRILENYANELKMTEQERDSVRTEKERERVKQLSQRVKQIQSSKRKHGWIQALYDIGRPPNTRLLVRGNVNRPGRPVRNGFLSVLCESDAAALRTESKPVGKTSGRRLALARWLTNPDSAAAALAARVQTNRIWHHLFARGIVATPGNFGLSGPGPTHPELLDWLANDFVRNGWKMKRLIRMLVSSTAYRQSSSIADFRAKPKSEIRNPKSVDPENHLLWRMRLKRLESEIIRDTILHASGKLDETRGGPPVSIQQTEDKTMRIVEGDPTPTSHFRRSLYILSRRNYHIPLMGVFDPPAITTNCTMRDRSTVVLQSLALLNDRFVTTQAEFLAQRIERKTQNRDEQIRLAFQIVLSRLPAIDEVAWSSELLNGQSRAYAESGMEPSEAARKALASLGHMLFNSNNFLYLE